ncbi:hypothetical protein ACCO45_003215 [Purpureocillium lilacinum]|uniref:Uncharacterized protein n=1 Tax=Purpureocillium lilacinum TaxID=33203 RepID=A0ACC4E098_PURLI
MLLLNSAPAPLHVVAPSMQHQPHQPPTAPRTTEGPPPAEPRAIFKSKQSRLEIDSPAASPPALQLPTPKGPSTTCWPCWPAPSSCKPPFFSTAWIRHAPSARLTFPSSSRPLRRSVSSSAILQAKQAPAAWRKLRHLPWPYDARLLCPADFEASRDAAPNSAALTLDSFVTGRRARVSQGDLP